MLPGCSKAPQELEAWGVGCRCDVQQQHYLLTIGLNIFLQQRQVPSQVCQCHQFCPQVCQHNACKQPNSCVGYQSMQPGQEAQALAHSSSQ